MTIFTNIADGSFPSLTDLEAIRLVGITFTELKWLQDATPTIESSDSDPIGALGTDDMTPSYTLYGREYPEVNRTLVSVLSMKWLLAEDYESFTRTQDPGVKLTLDSFRRLRNLLITSCPDAETIHALLTAIVVNDLGKNGQLASLVPAEDSVPDAVQVSPRNHDDVVYAAAAEHLLPSLEMMEPSLHADLLLGLDFGRMLNIAQFPQAECVTANLEAVSMLRGRDRAFALKFMEVILDVAGAGGHIDARCAVQMTEPVFQAYILVREKLADIASGKITPRQGYDCVLRARMDLLQEAGFTTTLSIDDPADRAQIRLLALGRVVNAEKAGHFLMAFHGLAPETRRSLVDALNVDGVDGQPAIVFSYAPALISKVLENAHSAESKVLALSALMRFLARINNDFKANHHRQQSEATVKDINLSFAQEIVKSHQFCDNPSLLDDIPIPSER